MEDGLFINAVVRYIESRVTTKITYSDLEEKIGYSYRYIRERFKQNMGISLKRYSTIRKLSYIAFEIETTNQALLSLATKYHFLSYDTFTRCFKREIGITPKEYRKQNLQLINHQMIAMGTYGPVLPSMTNIEYKTNTNSLILYGVPKVEFSTGKCTPFVACLESVLSYIGQRENYQYHWLLNASGISMRTCWNHQHWDLSISKITNLDNEQPFLIYQKISQAAGWKIKIVEKQDASKEDFFNQIQYQINQGYPVIVTGVIGPPEATIITGYHSDTKAIYGWSFFQDNPEFMSHSKIDESGYFMTSEWWETISELIILEETIEPLKDIEAIHQMLKVLTSIENQSYSLGQKAYCDWIDDISNDSYFKKKEITPTLLERFFCLLDAETMVIEGRYWAKQYFQTVSMDNSLKKSLLQILDMIYQDMEEMIILHHGSSPTEEGIKSLCDVNIRKQIKDILKRNQDREQQIVKYLEELVTSMSKTSSRK